MPDPRDGLIAVLQLAYSGERAAGYAYRGHWRSVSDAEERGRIRRIEDEEWHHRELVGGMLRRLGSAPSHGRELRALLIGRTLGFLCHVAGWLLPMYGAGRLERKNVGEYEAAARFARLSGNEDLVDCLLTMAEVEWDHEAYFRGRVATSALGRRFLWRPLPPKAAIRAAFAEYSAFEAPIEPAAPRALGSIYSGMPRRAAGGGGSLALRVLGGWTLAPILFFVCAGPAPAADPASAPASAAFEADVQPVLQRNCYPCHNSALKNADLNLTAYETEADVLKDDHTWSKVVQKVRTRVMPPAPFPPLSEDDVALVSGWIETAFTRAEAAAPPDPGRVTARRLNRTEYDNSVRDLLGVDLHLASDFPQDDSGYGFDNNGDVLSLSPALLEKYVVAGDRIARAAIWGPEAKGAALVRVASSRARVEASPSVLQDYDRSGLTLRNAVHGRHRVPLTATYVVRLILGGERPAASEPLEVGLFVDDQPQGVQIMDPEGLGSFSVDRQDFSGKTREFRIRMTAGEHRLSGTIVNLYEGLPPSYGGPNPSKRPAPPPREFKPPKDATPEDIAKRREFFEKRQKEQAPANDARVTRIEVLGPYDPVPGPSPESVRALSGCGSLAKAHGASCAAKILRPLVRRAYRRPVTPADLDPLVALVTASESRGDSFRDGLRLALQALLVSPDFLFRIERGRPAEVMVAGKGGAAAVPARVLTDHELGARLASFLWASLPDVQLLDLADRGELDRPAVLEAQVRRMLADPKAEALVEAFGGQWLQFRGLDSSNPDRERFPDFDSGLAMAMRKETELFLASVMHEDKSVIDLLDAPYTYVNERLAAHYGIPGVKGPEFRRVDTAGTPRGGVLTQGSVLTVSSYATRTSPVLRGKWILENVLNAPPPDPPPGTPRIPEDKVGAEAPLRQQLEAHRANATCAACHKRMDPLGFSLENFDAIGRFREQDGKWPVDASGVLPDGRAFVGAPGLRTLLRQDQDAFAACVTEKMLTYALGRGLERYDRRTVRAIVASLRQSDYRFSALVLSIVKSLPFQERREEKAS